MGVIYGCSADAAPPYVSSEPLNKMTETPPVKLCVHTLDLHHGHTASHQERNIMQHRSYSNMLVNVVRTFKC